MYTRRCTHSHIYDVYVYNIYGTYRYKVAREDCRERERERENNTKYTHKTKSKIMFSFCVVCSFQCSFFSLKGCYKSNIWRHIFIISLCVCIYVCVYTYLYMYNMICPNMHVYLQKKSSTSVMSTLYSTEYEGNSHLFNFQ